MHLLELNNDCLLTIFRFLPLRDRLRLPLICRALRDFGAKYDLHGDQLRLSCNRHVFCSELCHQPRDLDCFSFLFTSSNPSGSFDSSPTNQSRLDKLLRLHCHLHTLCLSRFVISNRLLQIISGHCAQLRHLSLNHVTFACSSLNWLSFANQILSQLVCIEFIGCNQLVEHYVTSALKAATSLQNFAISANDIPFNGYCFEHLPRSIRSVCILDIEQFANQGTIALLSIISGNGRDLRSLHLKGQISLKVLAVLCRQFVRLEKVTLGDYFEAQIVRNSVEIGRLLGRLHRLHSFSLSVPELLPFDRHLNQLLDQWTRVASLRSSLTELELKGASFHSQTLARFCSTLTQLTLLSIVYENQFESIVRPQPHSFAEVANLSRLRLLTLIGVNLQADTLQTILISCNELTFVDVRLNPWLDQLALLSIVQYARRHSPRPVTVIAIGCSFVRNLQHLQCRTRNWQTFVQLLPTLELFIDKNDADLDALYDESIDDEEFD